jgi:hypothetical protein
MIEFVRRDDGYEIVSVTSESGKVGASGDYTVLVFHDPESTDARRDFVICSKIIGELRSCAGCLEDDGNKG